VEEDRQLAAAGIPNSYDAYPDDRSKNWLRARSKLVKAFTRSVTILLGTPNRWVLCTAIFDALKHHAICTLNLAVAARMGH
jgi:hypothetical protein